MGTLVWPLIDRLSHGEGSTLASQMSKTCLLSAALHGGRSGEGYHLSPVINLPTPEGGCAGIHRSTISISQNTPSTK